MAIKIAGTTVIDDSRNITTNIGTVDGRDVSVDGAKLDLLDQGVATTDSPTFAEVIVRDAAGDFSTNTADARLTLKAGNSTAAELGFVNTTSGQFTVRNKLDGDMRFRLEDTTNRFRFEDTTGSNTIATISNSGMKIGGGNASATEALEVVGNIVATGLTVTDAYAWLNIDGSSTAQYSGGNLWLSNSATANNYGVALTSQIANTDTTGSTFALNEVSSTGYYSKTIFSYDHNNSTFSHNQYNYFNSGLGVAGDISVTGTVDGRDVAADGTKLDGIEAGATADQTAAEILTAVKTVDGAASGLDADLLDGLHASSFLQGNQTITLSGDATGSGTTSIVVTVADDSHNHIISNVDGLQVALDGKLSKTGNDTSTGYIAAEGFVNLGTGSLSILNPHNANYATQTANVTGAIKITLPVSWTNTMMRMTIRIYEYSTNEGFDVVCGGYNYSTGSTWINPFAYILGNPNVNRNFNVRFGHDGSKCCIYIGEVSSVWSYPQVAVTHFVGGYSSYSAEVWNDNWDVGFATAFGTVTQTITNSEVGRFVDGSPVWHSGNDGSGSGLDADLLDGVQGSSYLRSDASDVITGDNRSLSFGVAGGGSTTGARFLSIEGNSDTSGEGSGRLFFAEHNSTTALMDNYGFSIGYRGGDTSVVGASGNTWTGLSQIGNGEWGMWGHDNNATGSLIAHGPRSGAYSDFTGLKVGGSDVWHTGNDGSGSGLDADLLDGQQGSYYYSPANAPDPTLTLSGDASGSATFTNLGNATLTVTIADNSHNHTNYFPWSSGSSINLSTELASGVYQGSTSSWTDRGPSGNNAGALFNINTHSGAYYSQLWFDTAGNNFYHRGINNDTTPSATWDKVWTQGNDGAGSGLDADLLDGNHASAFALASHAHDYVPERSRTDWNDSTVVNDVIGQMAWKNYGNNHTIFDASASTSPTGVAKNNTDPDVPWVATYPTLMGYNGSNTYGIRVDIARKAELLGGLALNSTTRNNQVNTVVRTQANGYAEFGWINTTSGNTTTASSDYYVNTNDGYIRKKTLDNVRAEVVGGAGWGGVGSYAHVGWYSTAAHGAGATIAGSSLFTWEIYTSANGGSGWTGSIAGSSAAAGFGGTWRWVSNAVLTGTRSRLGLAVRIS